MVLSLNGTPAQSRTENTLPFERSDFANLSTGAKNTGYRIQCRPLAPAAPQLTRSSLTCLQTSAVEVQAGRHLFFICGAVLHRCDWLCSNRI